MSNQEVIEKLWDQRDQINFIEDSEAKKSIENVLNLLDQGKLRVCEKKDDIWHVNQWLKKAILLSFRIQDMEIISGGPSVSHGNTSWWDKVPSKFQNWTSENFQSAGFRAVPNCVVRRSAFIAKSAVLMPCFVNLGAYVDEGTMVDTWATVGSCAQIGQGVHLSGGVGIGGVLEPPAATPVIIEDGAFVGSRCIVVEGVRVGTEAVLGANVVLTASTQIIDVTGPEEKVYKGYVPPRSVVVPGTRVKSFPAGDYGISCALIIGQRKESTDRKTSLNAVLREFAISV